MGAQAMRITYRPEIGDTLWDSAGEPYSVVGIIGDSILLTYGGAIDNPKKLFVVDTAFVKGDESIE